MSLIQAVCKTPFKNKLPIIVIDDINRLTLIEGTPTYLAFQDLLTTTGSRGVKVIGVSSSSHFYLQVQKKDKYYPYYSFTVLQPLSWSDRNKMLASIINSVFLTKEPNKAILNYMMN